MKPLRAILLLALAASCEPPRAKNPLSDFQAAKRDARLSGVWVGRVGDDDSALITFVPRDGARFDVVLVGNDHDKGAFVLTFEGFPSLIGGKSYFNLRAKSFSGDYAEKSSVAERWIFARYEFAKDGALTIWNMDDEPVKVAINAGKLDGKAGSGEVEITASSAKLAAYVTTADPTTLFKKFGTFNRVAVEFPKPTK